MTDMRALKVPKALRPVVYEIVGITDAVCQPILDEEYADLARRAVAKLARKRPSPLAGGRRATWEAGIVYALGQANFLFYPASEPCVTADQLSEAFGVAKKHDGQQGQAGPQLLRISPSVREFQRADVDPHVVDRARPPAADSRCGQASPDGGHRLVAGQYRGAG